MLQCTADNRLEVATLLRDQYFDFGDLVVEDSTRFSTDDPRDYISVVSALDEEGRPIKLSFHVRFSEFGTPVEVYSLLTDVGDYWGNLPDWVIQNVLVVGHRPKENRLTGDVFFAALLMINESEFDEGDHFQEAERLAREDGFDGAVISYDSSDFGVFIRANEIMQKL